jgi:hypothetical protein
MVQRKFSVHWGRLRGPLWRNSRTNLYQLYCLRVPAGCFAVFVSHFAEQGGVDSYVLLF